MKILRRIFRGRAGAQDSGTSKDSKQRLIQDLERGDFQLSPGRPLGGSTLAYRMEQASRQSSHPGGRNAGYRGD